jgi:putative ABC transport system substrate-binding protein
MKQVAPLILGLLMMVGTADAQQPKRPYRIGVLHDAYTPSILPVEGLKAGLKALGLEEGRDLTLDIRFTRGSVEATSVSAVNLVKAGVDLIIAVQEGPTHAARAATRTIPIVFVGVGDPVVAGLVKEIASPGGNITGVSSLVTELVPKRLEILKALFPALRRVWAVYHVDDLSAAAAARKAQEVADLLKLEVLARQVRTSEELVSNLKTLRAGDGMLPPPAHALDIRGLTLDLHLTSRVPAIFESAFWVQSGAVASYGSDQHAEGVQAARLVAKILRGARPQDLPVEGSNRIELALNLKTAKALGVAIPREILARADRVIE